MNKRIRSLITRHKIRFSFEVPGSFTLLSRPAASLLALSF